MKAGTGSWLILYQGHAAKAAKSHYKTEYWGKEKEGN